MKKEFSTVWTPVVCNVENGKAEFEVWGRKYVFDNSFLPTSITSLGKELLEKPVSMTAVFGGKTGEWHEFNYILFEATDERAVVIISAMTENVMANATVTVEFDGFVKIQLVLSSGAQYGFAANGRNKPELTGLYLDISMNPEHAGLFHYWPNDKTSIIPSKFVMNSGKTEDTKLPFKPYLWMGDEEVGLGFFSGETDENFIAGDDCVKVTGSNMRITFLEATPRNWQGRQDEWVDALNPVTYTFGFHATPVKKFKMSDENHKIFHLSEIEPDIYYYNDIADRAAAMGTKWIILHEQWSVIQNYGLAQDEAEFKKFVKKCHKLGMKVMVYFGYEFSTLAPEFGSKCHEYLYKNHDGNFTGGWQRKPGQRAFMVCYNSGYSDVFLKRVEYVMDEYGVDGIYTDSTYVPWECTNPAHGCGYIDHNGKLHHTFPILAVREHVKKLYEIVHKRGGIIDTHQSTCCMMPTLSFCDTYFDGENIQDRLTDKDMEFLNLYAFRTEYMGSNYGMSANFISMTNEERTIKGLESLTLLHNVHTRSYTLENLEYSSFIWKIFDDLKLVSANWHPYWNNKLSSIAEDDAYTSAYETEDGYVIYAVDFKGNREITLTVPDGVSKITEKISGETYEISGGKAVVRIPQSTPAFFICK